jgi:hypothetical protein
MERVATNGLKKSRQWQMLLISDFCNKIGGGLNWWAQHTNLLAKMECVP